MIIRLPACLSVFLFAVTTAAQTKPIKVSYCELKKDLKAYNHKLIEVTAFVSHGFEDFTLLDPSCPSYPDVWLEYGGAQNPARNIDPRRVAIEGLAEVTQLDRSLIRLRQTRRAQGRFVYEWRQKKTTYMVVVSRPYWLSYYAKDPRRIAWIVLAAYEASCEGSHSVERIKLSSFAGGADEVFEAAVNT